MNPLDLIVQLIGFAGSVPAVGKYIAFALSIMVALPPVVTALVAIWHAAVMVVAAVSHFPGMQGMQPLVDSMKADEDAINNYANGKLLPFLQKFSVLPLPKAPAA